MKRPELLMSAEEVLANMVADHKGGAADIARVTGASYAVLVKKTNPRDSKYHITLREADRIADLTESPMLARYFAAKRGLICINAPDEYADLSDMALLDLVCQMQEEQGQWMSEIRDALKDGDIDINDFRKIKKEYDEFVTAAAEVLSRIQSYLEVGELKKGGRE